MMTRTRRWVTLGALMGSAACGCSDPDQVIPVGPPGVPYVRVVPIPEGGGAQALGEAAISPADTTPVAPTTKQFTAPPTVPGETTTTPTGLKYVTTVPGTGPEIKSGQTAIIHYTGTLADGSKFDSSRDGKNEPFSAPIGIEKVIPGWDQGVPGMKVGERRTLTIPPELGYGDNPQPGIPANSTLLFDVELIGIK